MEITFIGITVIVLALVQGIKQTKLDNKWLPSAAALCGAILGVACYFLGTPDFPAHDIVSALVIGISSGLAATGTHQAVTQFTAKEG